MLYSWAPSHNVKDSLLLVLMLISLAAPSIFLLPYVHCFEFLNYFPFLHICCRFLILLFRFPSFLNFVVVFVFAECCGINLLTFSQFSMSFFPFKWQFQFFTVSTLFPLLPSSFNFVDVFHTIVVLEFNKSLLLLSYYCRLLDAMSFAHFFLIIFYRLCCW